MQRIEKTVFISYRRNNIPWALAIFQNLTQHGYDVFFDYDGMASGDFGQVILENIKSRAHFLVLLTPSALDRYNEPDDWFRREVESAISCRRNIVPVVFDGFDFKSPEIANRLTGASGALTRYNALRVHEDYFAESMDRLRAKYLNLPLDAVLHPVSPLAHKVAKEQQAAAQTASVAAIQKTMDERLAACTNEVSVAFFKQRTGMPTNVHKNALAYRHAGKIHWYVWPTPAGAAVLQIDRFEGDEALWTKGLSNPSFRVNSSGGRSNLRFDLASSSDFSYFAQTVEIEPVPILGWTKAPKPTR